MADIDIPCGECHEKGNKTRSAVCDMNIIFYKPKIY